MKHKKAAFVSFRALVYLTTLEFLVLKSSSNHVFLLKLHLTKYIHTRACTQVKGKGKQPKQTLFESSVICVLLISNYRFGPVFGTCRPVREGLWLPATALCCSDCVRVLTPMGRCSPDANENKLLYFYGNIPKVQQRLLKNNRIIKWTPESLHLCWTDLT